MAIIAPKSSALIAQLADVDYTEEDRRKIKILLDDLEDAIIATVGGGD